MGRATLTSELGIPWSEHPQLTLREFGALLEHVADVQKAREMRQRTAGLV